MHRSITDVEPDGAAAASPGQAGIPRRGVAPSFHIDEEWLAMREEAVLEPSVPIVDPHHHFWVRSTPYLPEHLLADMRAGHNIRGTVYIEAGFAARADGDPRFAGLGEVEYANGIGALFASNHFGTLRACAGIVGKVDLTLGACAQEVMQACLARAPDRFRGVRQMAAWDGSSEVSQPMHRPPAGLLADRRFREGFARLAPLGLSFDAWCYHPQLPQLIALIDAVPDTRVIVDHVGGPLGEGPYAGRQEEVFRHWRASMQALAMRPQTFVKLGGLMARYTGTAFMDDVAPPGSETLAQAWRPYVETCIESFGPRRCMFESNFPPDRAGCSPVVLWNAFKRIAAQYTEEEKGWLFAGSAVDAYRLPLEIARKA
jgi:predicted TIM-barrel fold metal-dependent hydrolase